MTYNYILYERLIIIRKTMLVQCLHCWPIIYTTLCERHFYYMERGIKPNLLRQLVYYDVTDGGRGRMSATASASELTSDALYIRPHQINFMDDGFSAEKNGANEQIFFFFSLKKIDFAQQWSERRSAIFFFQKTDFPQKYGKRRSAFFSSKKET